MRLRTLVALGLVATATSLVRADDDPLVVHEWGTFTSMQGSDGITLEGLNHEEEGLPPFVYSRAKIRECPLRAHGYKGLEVPATGVTQKMETPVIYFHSKTARRVRVRVDFVKGLLTQWYPVSDLLGPPERGHDDGPLDVSRVERSFLQWDVDVIPRSAGAPSQLRAVDQGDPWSFARETSAAWVRTVPRSGDRLGPTEAEHYLFYRGLGTFTLPVDGRTGEGGAFTVRNGGDDALPEAFAVSIEGEQGRVVPLGKIPAKGEKSGRFGKPVERSLAIDMLKKMVHGALVEQGLFDDEAWAMVKTWARQWFGSEGTRVIYLVPRPVTDRILPLSIAPAPDRLVRVLVGRLELITPEQEALVERALRDRVSSDAAARARGEAAIARLDRFAEPHVRRALARTRDPLVRASAEQVLAGLK